MKVLVIPNFSANCTPQQVLNMTEGCLANKVDFEQFERIRRSAQEPAEYVIVKPGTPSGRFVDGSWQPEGSWMWQLENGVVDTFAYPPTLTAQRLSTFHVSFPVKIAQPLMLAGLRNETVAHRALQTARVFQIPVWLTIAVCFALLFFASELVPRLQGNLRGQWSRWNRIEQFFAHNTPLEGGPPSTFGARLIRLLFTVFHLFSIGLYQGYLLALLVSPVIQAPEQLPMEAIIDQIRTGDIQLLLNRQGSMRERVMGAEGSLMRRLRTAIQSQPNSIVTQSLEEGMAGITAGKYVHVLYEHHLWKMPENADVCQLSVIQVTGMRASMSAYLFAPNSSSTMRQRFDEAVKQNIGFVQREAQQQIDERFYNKQSLCEQKFKEEQGGYQPLPLAKVAGAFVLWLGGCVTAGLFFVLGEYKRQESGVVQLTPSESVSEMFELPNRQESAVEEAGQRGSGMSLLQEDILLYVSRHTETREQAVAVVSSVLHKL